MPSFYDEKKRRDDADKVHKALVAQGLLPRYTRLLAEMVAADPVYNHFPHPALSGTVFGSRLRDAEIPVG